VYVNQTNLNEKFSTKLGSPYNRHWVIPGQSTTSCLQLLGFFMMQRSFFKQMIVLW